MRPPFERYAPVTLPFVPFLEHRPSLEEVRNEPFDSPATTLGFGNNVDGSVVGWGDNVHDQITIPVGLLVAIPSTTRCGSIHSPD
jgi:hypothetical protein